MNVHMNVHLGLSFFLSIKINLPNIETPIK